MDNLEHLGAAKRWPKMQAGSGWFQDMMAEGV